VAQAVEGTNQPLAFEIMARNYRALVDEVQKLGGRRAQLDRLFTDPELRHRVAELIVSKDNHQNSYLFTVDDTKSRKTMLVAGGYTDYDERIPLNPSPKSIPSGHDPQTPTRVSLLNYKKALRGGEVLRRMDSAGFHPGTLDELLALGAEYANLQMESPIVALGSRCYAYKGEEWVGLLAGRMAGNGDPARVVATGELSRLWPSDNRFLAVWRSR
jgi:hypothetical protein